MHKNHKDLYILILSICIGVMIMITSSYVNYKSVQEHIVKKGQDQLLTISKSISKSIERFFDYQIQNFKIITQSPSFQEQFGNYKMSKGKTIEFTSLEDYYTLEKGNIDKIQLLNLDGKIIDIYPKSDESVHPNIYKEIETVLHRKDSIVGQVYFYKGKFYIQILQPIFYKSRIESILCAQISLDKINNQFVKPIRVGIKGYASVKDQSGVLLIHPKSEDIGENVIEARTREFPNYDWWELKELVKKQIRGESGVGIYHSIWYHDQDKKRIKKFSAYSPARIGDIFWIVNVSMDYLEMTSFVRNGTYKIILFNSIVLFIFISAMFYIYKIKKEKRQFQKEAQLLSRVKDLNKKLQRDIEERKCLEQELIQNKEKYERLFNSGSDCTFVLNLDENYLPTEFLEVNNKACYSLDYDKGTLLKMSYLDISKDMNVEKFKDMVEHLKKERIMIFEDTLITSHEQEIPVEISAHLFQLHNELKMILISRDITNRKIQEQALKRSEERFRKIINQVALEISAGSYEDTVDVYDEKNRIALKLERINIKLEEMFKKEVEENRKKEALMTHQSRSAAMGEMIADIAHQWRQPLSGLGLIFANIQDAYEYEELTDAYLNELIYKAQKLIKRMSQTIDDFRYFFDPRSEERLFSVQKNIESTISFLQEHLRLNQINLNISVKQDILVFGQSNQYSQVILNIIQNAIDALVEKRLYNRKIHINIYTEKSKQVVEIQDNGKGIDEQVIQHVFERYFTTKQKNKGTGLGLYMSRVIIEKKFHGNIEIFNEKEGACVRISIPIKGEGDNEKKEYSI